MCCEKQHCRNYSAPKSPSRPCSSRAGSDDTGSQNCMFVFAKVDHRLTSNTGRNISDSFVLLCVTFSLSLRWHPVGVEREEIKRLESGLDLTLKKRKSFSTQSCLFRFWRHGDLEELKVYLKIWWSDKLRVWTIPEGCLLQRHKVWELQLQRNNSGCENFIPSNRRNSVRHTHKKKDHEIRWLFYLTGIRIRPLKLPWIQFKQNIFSCLEK